MVPPSEILENPENPRRFFPEESLVVLRESIRRVGILVPLTVYKSDGKLRLLDGQRRLICANALGLDKIPVNIVPKPTTFQNIVTMFNIHALREPWELMPTALKLEVLTRMIQEQTGKKRVGIAHLSAITGMPKSTIRRCRILLSYPKQYQDLVLARNEQHLKTDFLIELYPVLNKIEKVFPDIAEKHTRDGILDRFIQKYRKKIITDVVDFREIKGLIDSTTKGVPKETVRKALDELISNLEMSIEEAYPISAQKVLELNNLRKMAESLIEHIKGFETKDPKELVTFREVLKRLDDVIVAVLKQE